MRRLTPSERRYGLGMLLLVAPFVWLVVASYLYCRWSKHADLFVVPYTQWLEVAPYWHEVGQKTKALIVGSALVPLVPPGLWLRLWWMQRQKKLTPTGDGSVRPIVRGPTDNLGHAAWLPPAEMIRCFPGPQGMLIGAVDRTPNSPLLVDVALDGPTHSMSTSGPGSHKTVTAIHRLWLWRPWSMVVFDPSIEIGPVMSRAGRPAFNQDGEPDCGPWALEDEGYIVHTVKLGSPGFNILDWIDVTDIEAEVHIKSCTEWVYDEAAGSASLPSSSQKDPYWAQQGKNLVTCLLAHILFSPNDPRVPKSLKTLRAGLCTPENMIQARLETINATSPSRMARDLASGLMAMKAQNTFSSIYSHAFGATSWLSVEGYADLVSGDAFRTSDVLSGKVAIFIQLTLRTLDATPAVGRAILGALLNPVYKADGIGDGSRVQYLIDEAWIFGPMKEIMLAYTTLRKYRATMHTIWASEAKFEEVWGAGNAKALRDACSWRSYGVIQDGDVAEKLSRDIGEHAVLAYSEGNNKGLTKQQGSLWGSRNTGDTTNVSEVSRRLIKGSEILRLPPDVLLVLARGVPQPIMCYTAPYYRYPEVAELMADNRFHSAVA